MKDDLQKSDSCGLKSERKKILTSSTCSLACLSTNLGAFCPMVVHLPSEKSILPYFSGPRGLPFLTVILTVKLARLGLEGVGKWHQLYLWRLVPSVERWSFSQPPKSPLRESEDIVLKVTTYPLWSLDSDSSRTKLDCLDGIFHLKFTISR